MIATSPTPPVPPDAIAAIRADAKRLRGVAFALMWAFRFIEDNGYCREEYRTVMDEDLATLFDDGNTLLARCAFADPPTWVSICEPEPVPFDTPQEAARHQVSLPNEPQSIASPTDAGHTGGTDADRENDSGDDDVKALHGWIQQLELLEATSLSRLLRRVAARLGREKTNDDGTPWYAPFEERLTHALSCLTCACGVNREGAIKQPCLCAFNAAETAFDDLVVEAEKRIRRTAPAALGTDPTRT